MPINLPDTLEQEKEQHARLAGDPRWQLLQRIVHSRTMRRATHLQRILLFVSELELLNPGQLIREQDIAQKVLGRKDDFDPAYDTIVRVQVGHLRHKLQHYFANEGAEEPLRLTIPKGSYVPIFEASTIPPQTSTVGISTLPEDAAPVIPADAHTTEVPPLGTLPHRRLYWAGLGLLLICSIVTLSLWKLRPAPPAGESSTLTRLFAFMTEGGNQVTVVLPDTSLLLIQKVLNLEIPLETYTLASYPENLSHQAKDPSLQYALQLLGSVRTTTLDEAQVGMDFIQALNKVNLQGGLRYARDLHIRDLGEGNYILIGNKRSNPWVTLFTNRCNFRYTGNPSGQYYVFQNMHPAPGEAEQFVPSESPQETTNYVDVTLTPNLTDSGYVLLIIGSDYPANEAAARFLMGEDLPSALESQLLNKNLRSVEILLRGHHFRHQSNDKLAIVAYRTTKR